MLKPRNLESAPRLIYLRERWPGAGEAWSRRQAMWLYKILICTIGFSLPFSLAIMTKPVCDQFFGRPNRGDCTHLLLPYRNDAQQHFMSIPPVSVKPQGVSLIAWVLRKTLPWVRDRASCNVALLSILRINGRYTWAEASYAEITRDEFTGRRAAMPGGIIRDCIGLFGVGGWRRIREWISFLNGD